MKTILLCLCSLVPTVAFAQETPDDVIASLVTSFNDRDSVRLDEVLDFDYTFWLSPPDIIRYERETLDRARDLAILGALLSGQAEVNRPPVSALAAEFAPQNSWMEETTGPYAGGLVRRYLAQMEVTLTDQTSFVVEGVSDFHVRRQDGTGPYRIWSWREIEPHVKVSPISWGTLRLGSPGSVATGGTSVGRWKAAFDR